jgi:hydrogenase-4 membrane subunit HyfE
MNTTALVLAQMTNTATDQARNFFGNTPLGDILSAVLGSAGLLLILFALVKAFKNVAAGMIAPAIKSVIFAVFVSAFLFNPALFGRMVDVASRVASALLETFSGIVP